MEKYMVTGFSGFVSKHFLDYLNSREVPCTVAGIDINTPEFDYKNYAHVQCSFHAINLLNREQVNAFIQEYRPDYILHLASYSSVAYSWQHPVESFTNNTNIFLNLLEQVRNMNLDCRILSVGSSEEYGNVSEADIPLRETQPLKPISPYAVARVSQEMLSAVYAQGFGLDVILTRSFNHIGPGQKDIFVISSFVKRMLEIKRSNLPAQLHTGDLTIVRDFLDVRDVVRAYYMLLKNGDKGEIYNICSGKGIALEQIINKLSDMISLQVVTVQDPALVRPNDNRIIVGDNSKLKARIAWETEYSLDRSLQDIIDYWTLRLAE
jgi:GDP-4-dehydro-6-deoxy-D-mannose reductase